MTSDSNLNPHEEIKSTSNSNYLNTKESMNTFFSFLLLTDVKVYKTILKVFYNLYHIIFKDIISMTIIAQRIRESRGPN